MYMSTWIELGHRTKSNSYKNKFAIERICTFIALKSWFFKTVVVDDKIFEARVISVEHVFYGVFETT